MLVVKLESWNYCLVEVVSDGRIEFVQFRILTYLIISNLVASGEVNKINECIVVVVSIASAIDILPSCLFYCIA